MPMVPSFLAAGVYTTVKVVGYAAFAHGLNKVIGRRVPPVKFAAAKVALGLAAGVTYLFLVVPGMGIDDTSSLALFMGAIPIRLLSWAIVLAYFYGWRDRPKQIGLAVFAGTAWSYLLDGLMSLFYRVLPGMDMPMC